MAGYTARSQSLFGNVGIASPQRPLVDVGGAISDLGNTAGSLISHIYERKLAAQQRQQQEEHNRRMEARADQELAMKRDQFDQSHQLAVQKQRRDDLINGITPGTEGGATVSVAPDAAAPAPPVGTFNAPGSIAGAMTAKMNAAPTPTGALTTPVTPGSLGTLPTVEYGHEDARPDVYEPEKAAAYVRQKAVADERLKATEERNATTLASRKLMGDYSVQVAKIRAGATTGAATIRANAKGGNHSIRTAMTPNKLEDFFEKTAAPGLLLEAGGNLQTAIDNLQATDEGKALLKQGLTVHHLSAAYAKSAGTDVSRSLKMQGVGMSPAGADSALAETKQRAGVTTPVRTGPPTAQNAPGADRKPQLDAEKARYEGAVARAEKMFTGPELQTKLRLLHETYSRQVAALKGQK